MNTPLDLRSPYQPPLADLSQPAAALPALQPHERSGAPKVFGVLSIIFAALVLLFSAFGVLMTAATSAAESMGNAASLDAGKAAEKAAEMKVMMPALARVYRGIGYQSLILFVMSAVLLAIGIGQVRFRAWACRWSVYWGVAGLVCVGAMIAISLLIISPAYADLFESMARLTRSGDGNAELGSAMSGMSNIFGGTFAILCLIVYAPYPALMLLFFTRERVRASMTS